MKLLFDENLAPKLGAALSDLYPGSTHVRQVGLEAADDAQVWAYAAEHGPAIVSKDSDFHQRSFLFGHPPKVVWVRRGNCLTKDVEEVLRRHHDDLLAFEGDADAAFLALG